MEGGSFFKGTSSEQDRRFSDKERKLLKSTKFPPAFDQKVDMRKVNLPVLKPWIAKRVVEHVGFEDEVVIEYVLGLLEDKSKPVCTLHSCGLITPCESSLSDHRPPILKSCKSTLPDFWNRRYYSNLF